MFSNINSILIMPFLTFLSLHYIVNKINIKDHFKERVHSKINCKEKLVK